MPGKGEGTLLCELLNARAVGPRDLATAVGDAGVVGPVDVVAVCHDGACLSRRHGHARTLAIRTAFATTLDRSTLQAAAPIPAPFTVPFVIRPDPGKGCPRW
jgi:hypothetical protein